MSNRRGSNSYAARGPSSTPMIRDNTSPVGDMEKTTTFENPATWSPSSDAVLKRRSTIAAVPAAGLIGEPAYSRQMTFSGSVRTRSVTRSPLAYEGFWEGHPNEIVYENPAMLEEEMMQRQTSTTLLMPNSIRARPPSSVLTIPPPPPIEELDETSSPRTPNTPPCDGIYEEIAVCDPPYDNVGRRITEVETTVVLGSGQHPLNYYAGQPRADHTVRTFLDVCVHVDI